MEMKRVTGIGGIFICSNDPDRLRNWYAKHLGLKIESYGGTLFQWKESPTGTTTWSVFAQGTEYLKPAQDRTFMVNYRVDNLDELLKVLEAEGVTLVGAPEVYEYGKFAWVLDCDGNKVELWEPKDAAL